MAEVLRQSSLYQTGTAYLTGTSVAAGLSAAATGASAALTSAVRGAVAWDTTSSETATVVSASITAVAEAVLSACTAGAVMTAGAAVSVVLKLDHNQSNYTIRLENNLQTIYIFFTDNGLHKHKGNPMKYLLKHSILEVQQSDVAKHNQRALTHSLLL